MFNAVSSSNPNESPQPPPAHDESSEKIIASKLPLNDTVEKENPNSFSDKIREAVIRFDTEQEEKNQMYLQQQLQLHQQQLEQQHELDNSQLNQDHHTTHAHPRIPTGEPTAITVANAKIYSFSHSNSSSSSSTPSPRNTSPLEKNKSDSKKHVPNVAPKFNHKVVHIISDADKENDNTTTTKNKQTPFTPQNSYSPKTNQSPEPMANNGSKTPPKKADFSFTAEKNTQANKPTGESTSQTLVMTNRPILICQCIGSAKSMH